MKSLIAALLFLFGCAEPAPAYRNISSIVGMDSFALAARYGTPASYQILEDYMQLTYGSDATGCRLIVLIDQDQRVAGWATTGKACATL